MKNPDKRTKKPWSLRETSVLFFIVVGVVIFYGNTIRNGFIHDDHGQIEHNTYIQSLMFLPKVFTSCIWESAVGNCKDTYYYRPLQSLSYMLTYQFSSQPWIFHVVNLLYFAIDVWLVYVLLFLLSGDTPLSILTAAIFLIHPLNTEVVNWAATVPELLFVLFALLSTISFVRFRQTGLSKYFWRLLGAFALGVLAKEPAVFLPFVWLVLDFVYFDRKIPDFLTWKTLKPYVLSVAFFLVYLIARIHVLGGLGADPYYQLTFPKRVYIFISLFGEYLGKLAYPHPLNLFYTFHPLYQILQPNFVWSFLMLVAFIGLLTYAVKKRPASTRVSESTRLDLAERARGGWKHIGFALIWYIAFLAPSLLFINSIGENLFAERHVFASTIGFALLLSLLLVKLWRRGRWGRITLILFMSVLLVTSFVVIYERNMLWRTDETIYADTLKKSPDADLIRYNLAYLYEQSGKASKANEQYGIIVKRHSWRGLDKVYNNLGDMARKAGNFELAGIYFQQSLAVNPLHVEAYNNLGAMSFAKGDLLTSLTYLCQANRINPGFQQANSNYDKLVGTISGMDEKSFGILYQSLLTGGTFHPVETVNQFIFDNKSCSSDSCLFTFTIHAPQGAFVFPYLIAGETDSNQIVRPRRTGIQRATGDIVLDIDPSYGSQNLHFTLPTCDRTYMQVTAGAK